MDKSKFLDNIFRRNDKKNIEDSKKPPTVEVTTNISDLHVPVIGASKEDLDKYFLELNKIILLQYEKNDAMMNKQLKLNKKVLAATIVGCLGAVAAAVISFIQLLLILLS